jgi:hypothetical protein
MTFSLPANNKSIKSYAENKKAANEMNSMAITIGCFILQIMY